MTRRSAIAALAAAAPAAAGGTADNADQRAAAPGAGRGAGTAAPASPASPASRGPLEAVETLDALARAKGLRYGSAVGSRRAAAGGPALPEAAYLDLVARECGVVVHENALKWQALRPSAGEFRYGPADDLAAWAGARSLALRGHTLFWHSPRWWPEWVVRHDFGARPAAEAERLLSEHVRAVCTRYGRQIASYDVVNESVDPDTGRLRDNAFTPHLGNLAQVELMFRLAHEHAPHAQLVYNDFMTWGSQSARHRSGVLALLQQLKGRGVPVHALGLQSHLGTGRSGAWVVRGGEAERDWRRFLEEATALGLELLITELDVNDRYLDPDPARRDAAAAAMMRDYLDVTLAFPQLRSVLSWGLADHHSWMRSWWPRDDGLAKRPAPYDEQLQPKPLRAAIAAALRAAPVRAPA